MSATSSALLLSDLALVWAIQRGDADLAMIDNDLASDAGLETAVTLSLFLDRRALDDDVPPSGDPADRRGWWGDQFLDVEGDRYGSRLWLLDRSKLNGDTLRRAEEYCREALAWMLEDRVVASVGVQVAFAGKDGMSIAITLARPGRDAITFRFARAWDAQLAATT